MKLRIFTTTTIAAAMISGLALAQNSTHPYASDDERMMYENNPSIVGFFTDDSRTELRGDDDVKSAYEALVDQDRDKIRKDCERVEQTRGSYGTVTQALCEKVMAM